MNSATVILATLIAYKVLLIGIGLWASRRVHDQTDFFLGGRRLGPWVAGLSYAASTSSAWVLLGFSGFVFANGVSALWMLPGIWGGYVAVWLWFGPRLREDAERFAYVTPTDFLCASVERKERLRIAATAALLILFCFVFYIAAQYEAAARAFVSQFGMDRSTAIVLGASIILVYCMLGGFWAVSVTDMLQGIVMAGAAILVPAFALVSAGGPAAVFDTLASGPHSALLDPGGGMGGFVLLGFVVGIAAIGLGTLGQPHLLARLMAVRGERERRRGFAIAITWAVVIFTGMAMLSLAARALALQPGDGEQVFYVAASALLPPVLAGIVIAAVLSAVMSTVDSLLLAAAAAVSHDLGLARRWPGRELWISRLVMAAIGVAAVTLALTLPDTIFNRVLFAWSALGAAFGPVIVARVMGVETSGRARLAAILTGFALTVLFYSYGNVDANAVSGALHATLAKLAQLPGDPFERIVPWLPALAIAFTFRTHGTTATSR